MNQRAAPLELSQLLAELASDLWNGRIRNDHLRAIRNAMDQLDTSYVIVLEQRLSGLAHLDYRGRTTRASWFFRQRSDLGHLARHPDLAWPFLFHRNGYVREAAIKQIVRHQLEGFALAALLYRLNDWVAPVRKAASPAARHAIQNATPGSVAAATVWLAMQSRNWGRWQDHAILAEAFRRPGVIAAIGRHMHDADRGPMAAVLCQMLAHVDLDNELDALAANARLSSVRAAATDALLFRRARWPAGWQKTWIDKSQGQFRWTRRFGERALAISTPAAAIITRAAKDRATSVRKIAADGLIRGLVSGSDAQTVIDALRNDRSSGIRERIAFVLRNQTTS